MWPNVSRNYRIDRATLNLGVSASTEAVYFQEEPVHIHFTYIVIGEIIQSNVHRLNCLIIGTVIII